MDKCLPSTRQAVDKHTQDMRMLVLLKIIYVWLFSQRSGIMYAHSHVPLQTLPCTARAAQHLSHCQNTHDSLSSGSSWQVHTTVFYFQHLYWLGRLIDQGFRIFWLGRLIDQGLRLFWQKHFSSVICEIFLGYKTVYNPALILRIEQWFPLYCCSVVALQIPQG